MEQGSDCEDEDSQHAVRIITNQSWLSTDHLTFWGELLNAQADDQQLLFCAARPLKGLHGSIGSLGFASHANNKLFIMPFQHRSHFFLVGVQHGVVRYYLDPMSMAFNSLNAFQKSSVRSIQSALDGSAVTSLPVIGAAAWQKLLGPGVQAGLQPQWQNAAAGDGYNCGVFCCMYMWEILHRRAWSGGDVADFRQHVALQLDCWWRGSQPVAYRTKRRRMGNRA